jgi:hypothetical protein
VKNFLLKLFSFALKPTESGLRFVKTEEFRRVCKTAAVSVIVNRKPYEELEARLRTLTIDAILPKDRKYSSDAIAEFFVEHRELVDGAWRSAIVSMMGTVDRDLPGTLARELGVKLPAAPPAVASVRLDHPVEGSVEAPSGWKEGKDYERV